jgi:hypothetical protein
MSVLRELHHVGYVVEDLRDGIARFEAAFGAGPFTLIEHLELDEASSRGAPARYDHSSAFGRWGSILVELTEVHDARPAGLRSALRGSPPRVGHVAWLADSLDDEVQRLTRLGIPPFHSGRAGPVSAVWFDAGALLGHPIEVLQRCDELETFYAQVRRAGAPANDNDHGEHRAHT